MNILSCCILVLAVSFGQSTLCFGQVAKRDASTIVREFHQVHFPSMSGGTSPAAIKEFDDAINSGCSTQAKLALELYKNYPDHKSVPEFLRKRWAGMNNALGQAQDVLNETLVLLKKEEREPIRDMAVLAACRSTLVLDNIPVAKKLRYARAACAVAPDDEHGALALVDIAKYHLSDIHEIKKICQEVDKKWRQGKWAGGAARGVLKQLKRLGEKVKLQFKDIQTQKNFDGASLKGHPYIVMVWGGFGSHVDGDLDAIKKRRSLGPLRIVGVFNWKFAGGRDGLATALKQKGIDWPQQYAYVKDTLPWQGNWATGQTPLYFLVDKDGKICSLSYRFKNVLKTYGQILPPLKKADAARKI